MDRLLEWVHGRVEALIGPDGNSNSTSSGAWYWFAPVAAEQGSALASALVQAERRTLVEALAGGSLEHESADAPRGLDAHVELLLSSLIRWTPESERPADLSATSAFLGAGAPGNIAWRALKRLRRAGDRVTELGLWQAASILASGLRTLFSRLDATLLLENLYTNPGTRGEDGAYWRMVSRYSIDGGLQAVLDEYIHHLAGEPGPTLRLMKGSFRLP